MYQHKQVFSKQFFLLCPVSLRRDWGRAKVKTGSGHDSLTACSADVCKTLQRQLTTQTERREKTEAGLGVKANACISVPGFTPASMFLSCCVDIAWRTPQRKTDLWRFGVLSYLANKTRLFVVVFLASEESYSFCFCFSFTQRSLYGQSISLYWAHIEYEFSNKFLSSETLGSLSTIDQPNPSMELEVCTLPTVMPHLLSDNLVSV